MRAPRGSPNERTERAAAAADRWNLLWFTPAKGAPMTFTIDPKAKASSHKIYVDGPGGIRVPARQVHLTDGTAFQLYDTSGQHSDPGVSVDVRDGLAPLRAGWIRARGDV